MLPFSLRGLERKKNRRWRERDLRCAHMRNERVLILLLPRDVVRLSNHFRGPPHGLPERIIIQGDRPPVAGPERNAPECNRALESLR